MTASLPTMKWTINRNLLPRHFQRPIPFGWMSCCASMACEKQSDEAATRHSDKSAAVPAGSDFFE